MEWKKVSTYPPPSLPPSLFPRFLPRNWTIGNRLDVEKRRRSRGGGERRRKRRWRKSGSDGKGVAEGKERKLPNQHLQQTT